MPERNKKNIVSTISFSICLLSSLEFANLALAFPAFDCDKANANYVVITSQGVEPIGKYCDFQERIPQMSPNSKLEYQFNITSRRPILKFGKPYNYKGSVCRDRGIDTICLSPNSASKLNELE